MLELKCEEKFGAGSAYDYNQDIEKTILQKVPEWVQSKCAIRKIIRLVSNVVKLNPFEACMLAWLLSKSSYDIEKISIKSKTNFVEEQFDYKVLVYLMMNAYYVKQYIAEPVTLSIDTEISSHISDFKLIYSTFHAEKSLKCHSLPDISELFEKWTCRTNKPAKTDYNNMVDKILELSKTYNVSGPEENKNADIQDKNKLGLPRKRRKLNKQGEEEIQSATNRDKSHDFSNNPFASQKSNNEDNQYNFRFTNSPEPDFNNEVLRQSLEAPISFASRNHEGNALNRRSTRNFLQSINHFQLIHNPSPDNNMFYSESQASNHHLGLRESSQMHQFFPPKEPTPSNEGSFSSLVLGPSSNEYKRRSHFQLKQTTSRDAMK